MSPRMEPDGRLTIVNTGTPQEPNVVDISPYQARRGERGRAYVAPANVVDISPYLARGDRGRAYVAPAGTSLEEIMAGIQQLGATAVEAAEAATSLVNNLPDTGPKAELLWRVNSWARGEYPGPSYNWPGERGMR